MTFLGYSKFMSLPTLAAGAAAFAVLCLEFRSAVPARIPLPELPEAGLVRHVEAVAAAGSCSELRAAAELGSARGPRTHARFSCPPAPPRKVRDRMGALLGSAILLTCLALLAAAPSLGCGRAGGRGCRRHRRAKHAAERPSHIMNDIPQSPATHTDTRTHSNMSQAIRPPAEEGMRCFRRGGPRGGPRRRRRSWRSLSLTASPPEPV
jgi:hypothetical protein